MHSSEYNRFVALFASSSLADYVVENTTVLL